MWTLVTLHPDACCVNIKLVTAKRTYHHGDLRAALLKVAAHEIERRGFETLSLRELASLIGVAHSAPYRHFADRYALLAKLAAQGFVQLLKRYKDGEREKTPGARLRACGQAYLELASDRPQLFRLMFASDLLSTTSPPDRDLSEAAIACYVTLEQRVRAARPEADERTIKAMTIAYASLAYGFALMRAGNRLAPFMRAGLSDDELVEALLSFDLTTASRIGTRAKQMRSSAALKPSSPSRRK
jgi:AcrR family transcriptional regulator